MARADHVSPEVAALPDPHIQVAYADVVDQATPRYHDPALLGAAIVELLRTVGRRGAPPPSNGHTAPETYIPPYDEKTGEYVAVYVQ